MDQPKKKKESGYSDSTDCELIIAEGGGDHTIRPITDPVRLEDIKRWMLRGETPYQQPPDDAPKPDDAPPSS